MLPGEGPEPCIVVTGDLDMARELLSMGGALVAGRVAMVLPSGTTDEQGERIRLAIRTIIDGARLAPPVVSGDARARAIEALSALPDPGFVVEDGYDEWIVDASDRTPRGGWS